MDRAGGSTGWAIGPLRRAATGSPWRTVAVLAVAGALVLQLLVPGGALRNAIAALIYAAVTAAVITGVRLHRPSRPAPWVLLAVAMGFFTLDLVGWTMIELEAAAQLGDFVTDATRLAGTLTLVAAVAAFLNQHRVGTGRSVTSDAVLVTVGGGLMFWQWYVLVQGGGDSGLLVTIGVPVVLAGLAVAMGVTAMRVVGVDRMGSPSMLLLATATALAVAAQAALTLTDSGAGPARWTDITWLTAGVFVGAAALHPTMAHRPGEPREWTRVAGRLVLLGAVLLANPAIVWLHLLDPDSDRRVAVAVAVAVGALTLVGVVRVGRLIAELGEMRTALAHRERRFRALVQNASDIVAVVDRSGEFSYVTPPSSWVLGYPPPKLIGTRLHSLVHPDDSARFSYAFAATTQVDLPAPSTIEVRMKRADGGVLSTEVVAANLLGVPGVEGVVVTIRDVTERAAFEAELRRMASHDSLTGLANRELFGDRVTHALERCARNRSLVGVVFIDLDDFKTVNDSLGHHAGDELLRVAADRLRGSLRTADTAARLGGDEFAVLLEDVSESADAVVIVERIREALRQPAILEGRPVRLGATMGLALGGAGRTAEELLRNADTAMFTAKATGKSRYEVFVPEMHIAARTRFDMKADLEAALDRREFEVYYQPVLAVADGSVSGVEALLRWHHPERGLVEPLEFIGLMEETGQILPVGRWVLREALAQASRWQQELGGGDGLWVSINLSVREFHEPDLVVDVADALHASGVRPADLVVEITESVFMDDTEAAVLQLERLKGLGVRLAIDDFGTGYSALSYLQRFRADIVKVDKSFVDALGTPGDDRTLTGGIVGLARALGIVPVAEGVERAGQVVDLRAIHCDLAQGFHLAVPQPAGDIDTYLARHSPGVSGRARAGRSP